MDTDQQKAAAAQACLSYNPLINTVFVTSNLQCFGNRNAAVNHARGLDDKEIDVFIRSDNTAVIDADQTDDVTNESLTVPDARLAVVNAQGGKAKFAKIAKSDPNAAPADDAATPAADPNAAPADDAAAPAADPNAPPAGDAATPTADPIAAPADAVPAADPNAAPADAVPAPVADSTITDKLNHIVEEVEEFLGANKPAANA